MTTFWSSVLGASELTSGAQVSWALDICLQSYKATVVNVDLVCVGVGVVDDLTVFLRSWSDIAETTGWGIKRWLKGRK